MQVYPGMWKWFEVFIKGGSVAWWVKRDVIVIRGPQVQILIPVTGEIRVWQQNECAQRESLMSLKPFCLLLNQFFAVPCL